MSSTSKPAIVVTGVSGNLGLRLLAQLEEFQVVGVDLFAPKTPVPINFCHVDVGHEAACRQLVEILKTRNVRAVVHLAFIVDPLLSGVTDLDRMWQINVAGTARVMEAITEVNRQGGSIDTFIFPSSVSVYGSETYGPVKEDHPLGACSLPYAIHKHEADNVVRFRADALGDCTSYILRPHIYAGASVQNYLIGVLRGTPSGKGKRAERMRQKGTRLPILSPNRRFLENRFQFVHVDDMARLIAHILRLPIKRKNNLTILNVAGRGESITVEQAAHIAQAKIVSVPGRAAMELAVRTAWKLGISGVPPEALPYLVGSYTMNTSRLKAFLGDDYDKVIQHTNSAALEDTFREEPKTQAASAAKKV